MKNLFGFIHKEFLHIIRDIRTLLILFGIPITQILMFGYVVSNDINNVNIAVFDQSNDVQTQKLINKINNSEYFMVSQKIYNQNSIHKTLKKGQVKAVLVLGTDFGKNLVSKGKEDVQLIVNATEANTASMISNYTHAIITSFLQEINSPYQLSTPIKPIVRMYFNEKLISAYNFVPGTMALILMLISAMMTSITIAREKETGTMEVLLVSPLKPTQIILGKVIPYILLSFINAITIISMGYFVFDLPINGSFILLMIESILFISVALSLGILISTVVKTQQVAMFISMFALMLPTMLLSGFIFPIENMPTILQVIANIIPAKWFIIIVKDIMIKGIDINMLWKETLVLIGFIVLFLGLSTKKFKYRLE